MPVLIILYFVTRLFHLTLLPIFNDESIYLYWAKLIASTHAQWFIALKGAKPPLLHWAMAFSLTLFPSSWYLFAGRLPTVITGFIGMLGIFALSNFLFHSRKITLLSAFLYIITPFSLFYDRIALFDSFLSSMLVWAVYFSLRTSHSLNKKDALLWGIFLGMAFLAKMNALLFLLLTPVCFFLFLPPKHLVNKWRKLLLLLGIAVSVSQLFRYSLLISRGYREYATSGVNQFTIPPAAFIQHPFLVFSKNIVSYMSWFISFVTVPVFVLGIVGFVLLFIRKRRIGSILALLWVFPMLATSFFSQISFPRYILFVLPYFLIAASYPAAMLLQKTLGALLFVVLLGVPLMFDAKLLFSPPEAPLPDIDYYQYVSGYPSGYGLANIFTFLHAQSTSKQITVIPLGMLSSYPYAFNLEFWHDPHVTVVAFWPVEHDTREKIIALSKSGPVYVMMKYNADGLHTNFLKELHLREIFRADKPNSDKPILLAVPQD